MRKKIFGRAVGRLASLLVMCLLAVSSSGQSYTTRALLAWYDLDSTSDVSFVLAASERQINVPIVTSGSATTVTGLVASSAPFTSVAVGDVIYANSTSGIREGRLVTARASADSITIDTAVNYGSTGQTFRTRARSGGTAATDGWFPIEAGAVSLISIQVDQLSLATGALALKLMCKKGDLSGIAVASNLWPGDVAATAQCNGGTFSSGYCTYTAAPVFVNVSTAGVEFPSQCRLVQKLTGTDDANDLTTNLEQVSMFLTEVRR